MLLLRCCVDGSTVLASSTVMFVEGTKICGISDGQPPSGTQQVTSLEADDDGGRCRPRIIFSKQRDCLWWDDDLMSCSTSSLIVMPRIASFHSLGPDKKSCRIIACTSPPRVVQH